MTIPPPSEGPSPETQKQVMSAYSALSLRCRHARYTADPPCLDCTMAILSDLYLAAKRSAHLGDARAGCVWCDPKANHEPFDSVREPQHKANWDGWWHFCKLDEGGAWRRCERPEVWDALSLLEKK